MSDELEIYSVDAGELITVGRISKTDEQWRQCLTSETYKIVRLRGTERAFSGAFWQNKEEGLYRCIACASDLFLSANKYDSGSGWPSFYEPVHGANVEVFSDRSHGMLRTEVHCARCGAHLGHVFPDGPPPTGKRYCINSASLDFFSR